MDKAAQLAASSNFGVFKEPRGFIRILEFFLAIFAFATTTSPSSYSEFSVACPGVVEPVTQQLPFYYPYRLTQSAQFQIPFCNATMEKITQSPCCDYNSPAEFYVFVGVMAFLYTLAAIILYVVFDETYRGNENIPTADFLLTVAFAVLWLISSSAWADGVSHIKQYIDPNELFISRVPECGAESGYTCTVISQGNFANLNVSLIFGFLNTFVWGGNCWFLFKESKWFNRGGQAQENMEPSQEQQHI